MRKSSNKMIFNHFFFALTHRYIYTNAIFVEKNFKKQQHKHTNPQRIHDEVEEEAEEESYPTG